jgi:hypothetical protein
MRFSIQAVDYRVRRISLRRFELAGILVGNPCRERQPIAGEMRLGGAQMRVGNLDYAHSLAGARAFVHVAPTKAQQTALRGA